MTRPWYPFYWSDYSGKTMHLTQGQHGAYILLLRYIYTVGKPIPQSLAYRVAQATLEQECENVDIVLNEFFTLVNREWHHERASEVMDMAEQKHKKLSISGIKGAKIRLSHAQATLKPGLSKSQPQPQPQVLAKANTAHGRSPIAYSAEFEIFWKTYPPNKGSKFSAFQSYQKSLQETDHDAINRGAGDYARYCADNATPIDKTAHGTTWLNQRRWEVDYSATTSTGGSTTMGNSRNGGSVGSRSIHQPSKAASAHRDQVLSDKVRERETRRQTGLAGAMEPVGPDKQIPAPGARS